LEPVFVPVVWSLIAGACFALGMVYLLAWFNEVGEREHLAFFVVAMSLGTLTLFELAVMRAVTPQQAGWLIRWAHVPSATAVLSIVAFLHFYFGSRRLWLGYAACALRLVATALNFSFEPNLNYTSITHLQWVTILGEPASVPVGVPNPWMALGWLSSLALLLFALDATYSGWQRGTAIDRRRAVLIGGSLVIWVAVAAGYSALVTSGVIRFVFLFVLPSALVMAAMAFELGADTVRTLQVTARLKQSEADLRRSEQRMQQAAEGAQLGIWEWDMQRDEIWATDQTRALFGVGPHTPVTLERFVLTLHPNDQGNVRQAANRLRELGGTFEQSYRVSLADGQARWLLTRGHTEADAQGRPLLLRGVSFDITDRKVAEFEAEQQRNELTHLSRVTTLSELSGSLTHELSQPLTAILSNAQAALRFLAKPDPDIDEVREILRDIASDDQRAGEVIRGLHLMLKRGELRQESIDANGLVRDVLKLVRGDILGAGVALTVDLAPTLPLLRGDRVQLQQVLLNLIVNACEAMLAVAPRQRQLHVSTRLADEQGVQVGVADRGTGIAAQDLERVFEPYFTTKSQGLGLGLSVCRRIIAAHGGRLWADHNPSGGAAFFLTLPGPPTEKPGNGAT
jgi:two-component system sensor kinase FixL